MFQQGWLLWRDRVARTEVEFLQQEVARLKGLLSESLPVVRGTQGNCDDELADRMQEAVECVPCGYSLAPGLARLVGQGDEPQLRIGKRILDPCCGGRMMWFDRQNPDVVFGDRRHEVIELTDRTLRIEPDTLLDFRSMPYADGSFKLVAFDPPHLIYAGPKSWLGAKYGRLGPDWREDIRKGFAECFRVLGPDGVLVFKWNEDQVKLKEVLALTDQKPLFGHPTGRKGLTHWLVFMKSDTHFDEINL